jgi:hypothetical protein
MKLLDQKFAPVTFSLGFVEAPFQTYCEAFVSWWKEISVEFEKVSFEDVLPQALLRLQPLQTPQNRYLLVETKSQWTAVFNNGLRTADVSSAVGHICKVLKCRGLEVRCVPDRSHLESKKDALQIYGDTQFNLVGPQATDWQNRVRTVRAMNDGGTWKFISEGTVQPYEQVESYKKKRIVDRFTSEMLASYCAALGINLFDIGFYGPASMLVHQLTKFPQTSPKMSIESARSHLYLEQ